MAFRSITRELLINIRHIQQVESEKIETQDRNMASSIITIIRELQSVQSNTTRGSLSDLNEQMDGLYGKLAELLRNSQNQPQLNVDELVERLQSTAKQSAPWEPDKSDPFSFSATIMHARRNNSNQTAVRGKLDSGCEESWISTEILERAQLENEIQAVENQRSYLAFDGGQFEPKGNIIVTCLL